MNKTLIIVLVIFGVLLLCACCGVAGFIIWNNRTEISTDDTLDPFEDFSLDDLDINELDDSYGDTDPTPPEDQYGLITGSVTYPSEFIPEEMTVCATELKSNEEFCTTDIIQSSEYLVGFGYELTVPPGSYHVYSFVDDGISDYRAYYNDFVVCGLSVECTSHEPIAVIVEEGSTVEGIDPGDWYNE